MLLRDDAAGDAATAVAGGIGLLVVRIGVAALRERGVKVHGVVMVGPENGDNRNAIEKYGGVPVLGTIPLLPRVERRQLIQAFQDHFDPGVLDRQ